LSSPKATCGEAHILSPRRDIVFVARNIGAHGCYQVVFRAADFSRELPVWCIASAAIDALENSRVRHGF
jgi:hypothetical protein